MRIEMFRCENIVTMSSSGREIVTEHVIFDQMESVKWKKGKSPISK